MCNSLPPLLTILLVLFNNVSVAQSRLFKNYSVKDGLAGSTVYHIFQDSKGFIWFGTDQGLSRYDGTEFKNYTIQDGLADNDVFRITEDSIGRLWMLCYSAHPCYLYNDVIHNADNDTLLAGINAESSMFVNLSVDKSGRVWILGKRVHVVDGNKYKVFDPPLNHGLAGIGYVENAWWLMTDYNVYNIIFLEDSLSYRWVSSIRQSPSHAPVFTNIGCFDIEALGRTRSAITAIKPDTTLTIDLTGMGVSQIIWNHTVYEPQDSILYISDAVAGIKALKYGVHPMPDPYPFLPRNESYTYTLFDKEGNTWISTLRHGVYFLPKLKIAHYKSVFTDGSNAVNTIFQTKSGKIFCGAECLNYSVLNKGKLHTYAIAGNITGKKVVRFCSIGKNSNVLLIATENGLYKLEDTKPDATYAVDNKCIKSMLQETDSSILVGTTTNAYRWTSVNNRSRFDTIWNQRVSALAKGKDGRIWLGSPKGLFVYERGLVKRFNSNKYISKSRVTDLICDEEGSVWVTTSKYGLFVITKDSTIQISTALSSIGEVCTHLFYEKKGVVWACLVRSIVKIEYSYHTGFKFKVVPINGLTGYDGLLINDILVDSTNIWLGTSYGLLQYPKQNTYSATPPPVYITGFNARDSVFTNYKLIELEHFRNNIQITYQGISYVSSGKLRYKYVLNNRPADTVYTASNTVNLNELGPGTYLFSVWCINIDGVWSTRPASIQFTVNSPFWKTWWFIISLILLVLVCILAILRLRITQVTKREQEKTAVNKRIAETELQAVRAQMNEHFIFNSLSSIQSFINQNDTAAASYYLANFGKLIRQTLEISESPVISLDDEINYLGSYLLLEKMRFSNKFNYKITNEVSSYSSNAIILPSMLLQPYVENAVRHGLRHKLEDDGLLLISFVEHEGRCKCLIDDNGIGRKRAMELRDAIFLSYPSRGIKLAEDKIMLFNMNRAGKMEVLIEDKYNELGEATGTRVSITIPINLD